jgi:uncharacterized protein (TIGR02001 family)
MKKLKITFMMLSAMLLFSITNLKAQEEKTSEESPFSVGVDVVSNYVWRGSALSSPSFQPSVKFSKSGFTAGVWGSFDFAGTYGEADPYISYTAPFGLSLGATDYYLTSKDLFNVSDTAGAHGFELNAGYAIKGLGLSANYILNEAPGVGTVGGDTYLQLGYTFKNFNVFLGAGNGWHTSDTEFKVCNIGIGATKEIKVTDSFSIPVFGQIVVNPDKEKLYVVVGLTF